MEFLCEHWSTLFSKILVILRNLFVKILIENERLYYFADYKNYIYGEK